MHKIYSSLKGIYVAKCMLFGEGDISEDDGDGFFLDFYDEGYDFMCGSYNGDGVGDGENVDCGSGSDHLETYGDVYGGGETKFYYTIFYQD